VRSEAQLDAIVEAKRARHPELRAPLTWSAFQAVCDRKGIPIRHGPLTTDAVLMSALGTAVIVLNSQLDVRRHTYRGAHELAHHWAHGSREPVLYTMRDLAGPDEREDEAEYIATRLLQGW
jgi:Zn-dependent peptidase ImmA (M78 family)